MSHDTEVKSLNSSPGSSRRFVFKTFSERVEDIDINVYHCLDKVKLEPSRGSCFFLECLLEWRELNTAEDFMSFYKQTIPFVQTLPLVLLHKDMILSNLLSRLHMKARLSLEPILKLIAILSRDLLEEFIPFLPSIVDSIVLLLKGGADRDSEIIKQIFMSWSCIMMHLQKYLLQDVVSLLKYTIKLRYYTKIYIKEFMAEATSFLLRNASIPQLVKGIRKIIIEVAKKPLDTRKSGCATLLFYVMKGSASKFHSRAERVLQLITDSSIYAIGDKFDKGAETVAEVVQLTAKRLCKQLEPNELDLLWNGLNREIVDCVTNRYFLHLGRILSVLISGIQVNRGRSVSDYKLLLDIVKLFMQAFITPAGSVEEEPYFSAVIDKFMQLMLCVLDGLHRNNDIETLSACSVQWGPVFKLNNSSLLVFTNGLLQKHYFIIYTFRLGILSVMDDLVERFSEEIVCQLFVFWERLRSTPLCSDLVLGLTGVDFSRTRGYLRRSINYWIRLLDDAVHDNFSTLVDDAALPHLWGNIYCFPLMLNSQEDLSLLMNLIDGLDRLLAVESDNIAGIPKRTWQSILGAALQSYYAHDTVKNNSPEETTKAIQYAISNKSSQHVLLATADYLDHVYGSPLHFDSVHKVYHPDLSEDKVADAIGMLADNLCSSDQRMRVATLRVLGHYESVGWESCANRQPPETELKTELSEIGIPYSAGSNVVQLLLSIETTPLSISTSRRVMLLISTIQMHLSAGRVPGIYVPLVLNAVIGIFHARFRYLWNPTSECLAVLIQQHMELVWDKLIHYIDHYQAIFQAPGDQFGDSGNRSSPNRPADLAERFLSFVCPASDSTPCSAVLLSLLQTLQKIYCVVDSHSQQIVPLFLQFLGYEISDAVSVGSFCSDLCGGHEWNLVLKEWLKLLRQMLDPKSVHQSQFLRDVLLNRLLDETDEEIQFLVIDCLLLWKDDFLLPYDQHLKKLISSKHLGDEITTWSLNKEACQIEENHRAFLVPLVIRLLMPKIRKLKTLASRKANVNHRKALLCFLAHLDVDEVPVFFALLLKSLKIIPKEADGAGRNIFWTSHSIPVDEFCAVDYLKFFTLEAIAGLSWKKRRGFLHVVQDVLDTFDYLRIAPFLDLIMGCVVRVLGSCASLLAAAMECKSLNDKTEFAAAQSKEVKGDPGEVRLKGLRALSLKIITRVLNKYEDYDFGREFWDMFFASVEPLLDSFKCESSSSMKPSSLFSCLLVISRTPKLVLFLRRKKDLISEIFSILNVKSASDAVILCVLQFVENLLNLDAHIHDGNSVLKSVLPPNLHALFNCLHLFYQRGAASKRRFAKCPREIEIRIFKLLPKYVSDTSTARKFFDILIPFLTQRAREDICLEAVRVICGIIRVLGGSGARNILKAASQLLVYAELDLRSSVLGLLDVLAETDPSVLVVADLLRKLNAMSASEVGALDFDTIINAYEGISCSFFCSVRADLALVVLSHCVYNMASEELILRHSAYGALLSFIEFSSLVLSQTTESLHRVPPMVSVDGFCWTGVRVHDIITKFLLIHMGDATNRGNHVDKGWIELLKEMALRLPQLEHFSSLKDLCSDDPEKDFFNNITHLQKHRRARALLLFRNVISRSNFTKVMIDRVFLPLIFNMMLDVQAGKDDNIRYACLEAIASISARLEYRSYLALLRRCFREMKKNPGKQGVFVQLVCSIFDKFHFLQGSGAEAQISLQKSILPKIQTLLDASSDSVSINIFLAALKLLKLLPGDVLELQSLAIIQNVANFLKNRSERIRNEARSALAACLRELGLECLQCVVSVLRATLSRGFELHVLGFTVHFILSKFFSGSTGRLDHCLGELLSIVEDDVLGHVAEHREGQKMALKMKETRKWKSLDTLKLISQHVTFRSHAADLLQPVKAHLQSHLASRKRTKVEEMLKCIAAGIESNSSVDQADLFVFVHGLLEEEEEEEDDIQERGAGPRSVSSQSHLVSVFALRLFHGRLKKVKLGDNDEHVLSMLDPFVGLMGDCLSSKYEGVVSASLGCLAILVRLPLPSLSSHAERVKVALLDMAQSSASAENPLMISCFKLLTVLLQCTAVELPEDQLNMLVHSPLFADLERNPSAVALVLLKQIVRRQLVAPEIYDVMKHVGM